VGLVLDDGHFAADRAVLFVALSDHLVADLQEQFRRVAQLRSVLRVELDRKALSICIWGFDDECFFLAPLLCAHIVPLLVDALLIFLSLALPETGDFDQLMLSQIVSNRLVVPRVFTLLFIDDCTKMAVVVELRARLGVDLALVTVLGAALAGDELLALRAELRIACKVLTDAAFEHLRHLAVDSDGVDHFSPLFQISDHVITVTLEVRVDFEGVALDYLLDLIHIID